MKMQKIVFKNYDKNFLLLNNLNNLKVNNKTYAMKESDKETTKKILPQKELSFFDKPYLKTRTF